MQNTKRSFRRTNFSKQLLNEIISIDNNHQHFYLRAYKHAFSRAQKVLYDRKTGHEQEEREREKRKEKGGKTRVEREEVKKEKEQELDDDQQECPYVRSIS